MKILIISQYYKPDPFRLNELAEGLVELGHDVTVLSGTPNYTKTKQPNSENNYKGVSVVRVPTVRRNGGRLTRSYGPTMLMSDTKAISQFIRKGIAGEDIVLKSAGTQYYSYTYVADAVAGLLTVLLKGECGEAYNIADIKSDIMLKDLAAIIARMAGKEVVFELPDEVEAAGYSKATKARLDGSKLHELGWKAKYDLENGLARTITILRNMVGVI